VALGQERAEPRPLIETEADYNRMNAATMGMGPIKVNPPRPLVVSRYSTKVITDRWRCTLDGFEAGAMMNLGHVGFTHPSYRRHPPAAEEQPSIRVGALVACDPLGPGAHATSDLRRLFREFLGSRPVMELVTALTSSHGLTWTSYGDNAPITLEAIFSGEDQEANPAALAMLLLPVVGQSMYGRDSRCAEFVLFLEPRTPQGTPTSPISLAAWYDRFTQALALPAALDSFLTRDLDCTTANEPPAQAGIWLNVALSMTELIDSGDLRPVPGSIPSVEFIGYAIGDARGRPANATAQGLLRQMCDHTLHLDGYESVLASLESPEAEVRRTPPPVP